ncbi:hypothetical protein [uncultured Paludibaculum sp.]|uniref:hypothetical protein n=1 Tax=uncultured Paludibaculum sp. TaxID=1765020 RepID=UPI002AAB13C0|nr:hypothetical protein [uncultured Paludibaculum sp.]
MKLNHSLCACTLTAALAIAPTTVMAASNVAENMMKDASAASARICDDAQALSMAAPDSSLSHQGEAARLASIKLSVQQISEDVAHLNLWSNLESTPEQKAVRESNPLLKSLAEETTGAIQFLNDHNASTLFQPEYREHLQRISQDASQIRALFRESTRLNALSHKAAHLREQLSHS